VCDPRQQSLDLDGGGIIRVEKRERFLTIENRTVRDKRLSFGARGLHHFILSFPNHWELKVKHLIKQSPAGRDAVYSLLRELEKYRYLIRKRMNGHKGKILWLSTVYETPQGSPLTDEELRQLHGGRPKKREGDKPSLPLTAWPYMAEPDTAKPDTVEPYTVKPDTAKPDAYELLSEESPSQESLSSNAGQKTPGTHTHEKGAAESVGVGKFSIQEYETYCEEIKRRGEHVESVSGLASWLKRTGEFDHKVARVLAELSGETSGKDEPLTEEFKAEFLKMLIAYLDEGRSIEELDKQFSGGMSADQWGEMRAAALASRRGDY
jgi:hypothetical protein